MYLEKINIPSDLKQLTIPQLEMLSGELRQYIIDTLANHPGHLASSLGTVELSIALHYVFNTPDDKLVWDVGHQAYAHKILTGRRDRFATIRTYGGLSGFPRRDESEYDAFGTGHSSTSISAVLGMAVASQLQGLTDRQHIAVIGDGSMTGGEAFEALNNASISKTNMLVVLNDNGISIDKAVGGLSKYLVKITASHRYNKLKEYVWDRLGGNKMSDKQRRRHIGLIQHITFMAKYAMLGAPNLFEALGFRYFGPIDGHNIEELVSTLEKLKDLKGPKLLHVITTKGKGMRKAEQNPVVYHAPGKFDAETGAQLTDSNKSLPPRYQDVFGETIVELASQNSRIVGITPAMPTGCSLNIMMRAMPHRAFDVGIAEQHSVTFAAGLAAQGMLPFCNLYSSFMQRAYDQILHDVALQKLPVVFCLDRAGLVGDDGATHHGVFDMACLRCVPNLTICAPMDEHELRCMMYTAQLPNQGPVVIRYPRGRGVKVDWRCPFSALTVGKGRVLTEGDDVALVTIGHVGNSARQAAQILAERGVSVAHYDMRYLKPLDTDLLRQIANKGFRRIVTVEDGVKQGGFGSAVLEYMETINNTTPITILGIPDYFVAHGTIAQLQRDCGYDVDHIVAAAVE
ncbi:MAG: 1-deoxy-D-xylulose-5-phosphate synthase [Bacteroidales bacterium]|nr:1-deoxy-D-xylulose-5-phosphate synthase [Candidatus Colimorpha onthohippi]